LDNCEEEDGFCTKEISGYSAASSLAVTSNPELVEMMSVFPASISSKNASRLASRLNSATFICTEVSMVFGCAEATPLRPSSCSTGEQGSAREVDE
jgi:hypothetical protein